VGYGWQAIGLRPGTNATRATFSANVREAMRSAAWSARKRSSEIWKIQPAAEAIRWRRQHGDGRVPALVRERIRLTPFVIARRR
jgi:hypothetical protein